MQVPYTNYQIGTDSWKQRTPLILKFICDLLIFTSLIMSSLWSDVDWILKTSVAIKLLSNFISEHMPQAVQQNISDNKDNADEQ